MPRNNKAPPHTRGSKIARGSRGGRGALRGRGRLAAGPTFAPPHESSAGFTLADEARNTSQHDHSFNTKLRTKPVTFISAGSIEPLKTLEVREDEHQQPSPPQQDCSEPKSAVLGPQQQEPHHVRAHATLDGFEASNKEAHEYDDGKEKETEVVGPEELEEALQHTTVLAEEPTFFFDLTGTQSRKQAEKSAVPIPDRPWSRDSSSSDEVILFKGRDLRQRPQQGAATNFPQTQTAMQVVKDRSHVRNPEPDPVLATYEERTAKSKRQRRQNAYQARKEEDDDAIIADYIANMRENGETDDFCEKRSHNSRDLGGTESDHADSSSSDDGDATTSDRVLEEAVEGEESESELDDETLAKLIAGQELGGEELGSDDSSSDSDTATGKLEPDESLDKHDEFDLMDWYRPSVRRRKGKGARAQINFNVSDSELEQTLQAAWKSDRLKKSERKKQREELRALGMLGQKAKPEDLRVKYPNGMDMDQVAEELRAFLLSSDETLALPPMDNNARKMIHDLSNKFKIKSKSTGKADQRRPVLYRTLRTLPYVESTFDQAMNRVTRRYLPRLDMKGKRAPRTHTIRSNHAAAGYREGEIVGAAAPEIGIDNRGRNMLEKMGWSSGTALGATHNKGILQPVTHAMKNSKAGLG